METANPGRLNHIAGDLTYYVATVQQVVGIGVANLSACADSLRVVGVGDGGGSHHGGDQPVKTIVAVVDHGRIRCIQFSKQIAVGIVGVGGGAPQNKCGTPP